MAVRVVVGSLRGSGATEGMACSAAVVHVSARMVAASCQRRDATLLNVT